MDNLNELIMQNPKIAMIAMQLYKVVETKPEIIERLDQVKTDEAALMVLNEYVDIEITMEDLDQVKMLVKTFAKGLMLIKDNSDDAKLTWEELWTSLKILWNFVGAKAGLDGNEDIKSKLDIAKNFMEKI